MNSFCTLLAGLACFGTCLLAASAFAEPFSPRQIISTQAMGANSVIACDIDLDGDPDLVSASRYDDKLAWYENLDGQGSFGAQQLIQPAGDRPQEVIAADLDQSGTNDLVACYWNEGRVVAHFNVIGSEQSWVRQVIASTNGGPISVEVPDVDGDGLQDIAVVLRYHGQVVWYRNQGLREFAPGAVIASGLDGANSASFFDVDGDGDLDLATASLYDNRVAWFENLGDGLFGAENTVSTSALGAIDVRHADMDGDGDLDLLAASRGDDSIRWFENGPEPFAVSHLVSAQVDHATSLFPGDLDGDGDIDLVTSAHDAFEVSWHENLGEAFAPRVVLDNLTLQASCVQLADMDGDLDLDILSTSLQDGAVSWYRNQQLVNVELSIRIQRNAAVLEWEDTCPSCRWAVYHTETPYASLRSPQRIAILDSPGLIVPQVARMQARGFFFVEALPPGE